MNDDIHLLFQQMGEALSGIRGLYNAADIRQAQTEQLYDLVRSDLTSLRYDQRVLEDKFERMSCLARHDIESLRISNLKGSRSIQDLVASVNALKRPIAEMVTLKSRATGVLFIVGVIANCAFWLAEPLYRWLIETVLQRR